MRISRLLIACIVLSNVCVATAADPDEYRPQEHSCPILLEVMTDPVIACDGHSYERRAIEQHFRNKNTSPKTNLRIGTTLTPNHALKALIRDWKEPAKIENAPLEESRIFCQTTPFFAVGIGENPEIIKKFFPFLNNTENSKLLYKVLYKILPLVNNQNITEISIDGPSALWIDEQIKNNVLKHYIHKVKSCENGLLVQHLSLGKLRWTFIKGYKESDLDDMKKTVNALTCFSQVVDAKKNGQPERLPPLPYPNLSGASFILQPDTFDFSGKVIDQEDLDRICNNPHLTSLNLSGAQLTVDTAEKIGILLSQKGKPLDELNLSNTKLTPTLLKMILPRQEKGVLGNVMYNAQKWVTWSTFISSNFIWPLFPRRLILFGNETLTPHKDALNQLVVNKTETPITIVCDEVIFELEKTIISEEQQKICTKIIKTWLDVEQWYKDLKHKENPNILQLLQTAACAGIKQAQYRLALYYLEKDLNKAIAMLHITARNHTASKIALDLLKHQLIAQEDNQRKNQYNTEKETWEEMVNSYQEIHRKIRREVLRMPIAAKGHADIYWQLLKGKLFYENKESGEITALRVADLQNPLDETFKLPDCDAGNHVTISMGYWKGKKTQDQHKIQVWIAPQFLIAKNLSTLGKYYADIMKTWSNPYALLLLWTYGNWDTNDKGMYHAFIDLDADISSNSLYRKQKVGLFKSDFEKAYEKSKEHLEAFTFHCSLKPIMHKNSPCSSPSKN